MVVQSGDYPIGLQSSGAHEVGFRIQNGAGNWFVGIDGQRQLKFQNKGQLAQGVFINIPNERIGIGGAPGNQKVQVYGGILLGNKTIPTANLKSGTVFLMMLIPFNLKQILGWHH